MMRKISKIDIAKNIASILGSRDVVESLEQLLIKSAKQEVNLDFKNVKFISRSAAYQLLRLKEKLFYKNKIKLRFINLNPNVSQMLKIVAAQLATEEKKVPEVKIKKEKIT